MEGKASALPSRMQRRIQCVSTPFPSFMEGEDRGVGFYARRVVDRSATLSGSPKTVASGFTPDEKKDVWDEPRILRDKPRRYKEGGFQ